MQIMATNKKYPVAAVGFTANVVTFDGNDAFDTTSGMGASDNQLLTIAFWYNSAADSTNQVIVSDSTTSAAGNYRLYLQKADSQTFNLVARSAAAAIVLNVAGGTHAAADGWEWIAYSVDLSDTGKRHVYHNDTPISPTWTTYSSTSIDWSVNNWRVGDWIGGGQRVNGDIAELYVANQYIDLSVEANRRKFIDASGCPVNLGSDGSTPTGTAPLVYMKGNAATWNGGTGNNSGSGNDFTSVTGAVTDGTAIC